MDELFRALREQFGQQLTDTQHAHVCAAIERFARRGYVKFAAGAAEHKSELRHQPVIKDILWEVIDLYFYTDTACEQALHEGIIYSKIEKKSQEAQK